MFRIDPAHGRRKCYPQSASIGQKSRLGTPETIRKLRAVEQTVVEVVSVSGSVITAIITSDSLTRFGLKPGMLITAEVKAPWIQLGKDQHAPNCSTENMFQGTVCRITKNRTTAEVVVRLPDGTELCAIITEKMRKHMDIQDQMLLWAFFGAYAIVLHVNR